MKIAMFAHFKEYHGNHKNFKSLYDFGGSCLKIRDVCMNFEPYFKVHNLVYIHLKWIILRQVTNLNMVVHVVVSVNRFVKFQLPPSSLLIFGTGNLRQKKQTKADERYEETSASSMHRNFCLIS